MIISLMYEWNFKIWFGNFVIFSSLAILLVSLACLLSIAPVQGKPAAGCVIEDKMDYPGNDIKKTKAVENQEACAKLAAANEKAKFWTYLSLIHI